MVWHNCICPRKLLYLDLIKKTMHKINTTLQMQEPKQRTLKS